MMSPSWRLFWMPSWLIAPARLSDGTSTCARMLATPEHLLDRSFLALNHWAASIMAFRKIKLDVNIICG